MTSKEPFNEEIARAIAPGWGRWRASIEEISAPVREWMIRELAPSPGDTVLELAAGAGDTGFEAARIVGDHGRLISTDLSPEMLEAARRRGAELRLDNVEYRLVDAERIELDTDSVDGVLCRYGYMLMPDPAAALSETRRVLRPGGRLTLAVFGAPENNPFFAIIAMRLAQSGHLSPPAPEAPGIFAMADEERTRNLLGRAGFDEVRTEEVRMRFPFRDVDAYLDFVGDTAGPIALALRAVAGEERDRIRVEIEQAFAPYRADGGYELPGVSLAATAS